MNQRNHEEAVYMELTPDAWHQTDEGTYYIDCPECGSAASLMNVVMHGRCNGHLDQREGETKLDEEQMNCTARLWFELGYTDDPRDSDESKKSVRADAETSDSDDDTEIHENDDVDHESPPGTDGTVETDGTKGTEDTNDTNDTNDG